MAIDLATEELGLAGLSDLPLSARSYGFLVNSEGQPISHPRLDMAQRNASAVAQIEYRDISYYESDLGDAATVLRDGLLSLSTGEMRVTVNRTVLRGDPLGGTRRELDTATYYWRPVPMSPGFAVGLVLSDSDAVPVALDVQRNDLTRVRQQTAGLVTSMSYHNLGLYPMELVYRMGIQRFSDYMHEGMRLANATSTFKVAPSGFINPAGYVRDEPDMFVRQIVYSINNLAYGEVLLPSPFHTYVLPDIYVSALLDPFWQQQFWRSKLRSFNRTASVFMGTERGVFRQYPGTYLVDRNFDPREQPWYTLAKAGAGKVALIAPRPSPAAAGMSVRLCLSFVLVVPC